jgi:hypothetical protein
MRRAAPLLLALLLAGPVLAQAPAEGPSHAVVPQPTYTVGDFWEYRVTLVADNGSIPQQQVIRVAALGTWEGVPAYRLFAESVQDIPGDAQTGSFHSTSNKTTWMSRDGLRVLRIEEETNRTQSSPGLYTVLTTRHSVWTFHEPMDLYQFPILKDDQWVVRTNATVNTTSEVYTHVAGSERRGPPMVPPQHQNATFVDHSATQWVRQDSCGRHNGCTTAGNFTGVVLISRSGNATIRDFWSPQVGNLVRREILNETGGLVETSMLQAYRLQSPPPVPAGPAQAFGAGWLPLAGAAVLGIVVALAGLALLPRLRKGPPPQEAPPPDDPAAAPPAESTAAPPEEPRP